MLASYMVLPTKHGAYEDSYHAHNPRRVIAGPSTTPACEALPGHQAGVP